LRPTQSRVWRPPITPQGLPDPRRELRQEQTSIQAPVVVLATGIDLPALLPPAQIPSARVSAWSRPYTGTSSSGTRGPAPKPQGVPAGRPGGRPAAARSPGDGRGPCRPGVRVIRHSERGGQPRGVLCGIGHCFECRVKVNGERNLRSCLTPLREEMVVESQQRIAPGAGASTGGRETRPGPGQWVCNSALQR